MAAPIKVPPPWPKEGGKGTVPIAFHFQLRPTPLHLAEPSPQRTPVLYQAGSSTRGREFAAAHAECVFVFEADKRITREIVADIRGRAAASATTCPAPCARSCSAGRGCCHPATQPPSWRVPPARHLQQEIRLKFGERITRIWFPFRASGAKRETMF
jgi:hypothetical protein